ncbi:hypothetical protein chiPu_0023982, partial [Chiloscyllium punctatum]|nr:hypothetical protein [Chiloscyllium punctatum]
MGSPAAIRGTEWGWGYRPLLRQGVRMRSHAIVR